MQRARLAYGAAMGEVLQQAEATVRVVRLRGAFTFVRAVGCVTDAIARAKDDGTDALLVDLTGIAGISSPGIGDRHWLMTEWAKAGRGAVRVALLIRPEFVDPDDFGTSVAISRGFDARGFLDEGRALEWLRRSRE